MDTSVLASRASSASSFLKHNSLLILLLTVISSPALALEWEISNLGILPGAESSTGSALNDLGQVTGEMVFPSLDGDPRPIFQRYVYISGPNGGPLQLIDTSTVEPGVSVYKASEINNSAQVVGTYQVGSAITVSWRSEANGGAVRSTVGARAIDINSSGTVLNEGFPNDVLIVAPNGNQTTIVGSSPGAHAAGINDAGQVAIKELFDSAGALWSESSGLQPILVDGKPTRLYDINNNGQLLGSQLYFQNDVLTQLFFVLDPDGTVHTLNVNQRLFNDDFRLNDNGQVAGVIKDQFGFPTFSFLTSIGTDEVINLSMEEDIIAAGWSNIVVSDINNLGQLSGTGVINGATRAFLLTPIPEPETYAMMMAGLSMLGFMRRRKQ